MREAVLFSRACQVSFRQSSQRSNPLKMQEGEQHLIRLRGVVVVSVLACCVALAFIAAVENVETVSWVYARARVYICLKCACNDLFLLLAHVRSLALSLPPSLPVSLHHSLPPSLPSLPPSLPPLCISVGVCVCVCVCVYVYAAMHVCVRKRIKDGCV